MPRPPSHNLPLQLAVLATVAGLAYAAGAMGRPDPADPVVGAFTVRDRDADFLIAAPHGKFDGHTDEVVLGFCDRVAWNCLIAEGFETEGRRINVNRPTEGHRLDDTKFSPRAEKVYKNYMDKVHALAPRLQLYVEIHGNNHPDGRDLIEIATAGISPAWAEAITDAMEEALHRHGMSHLQTRIDVLDDVRYAASHTREFGSLSLIRPALHIELPSDARTTERDKIIRVLADALPQAASFDESSPQFASLH